MYKIIKIDGDIVFVGKQGGEFTQIPKSSFGFDPKVGDMVEFYQNGDDFIVSKSNHVSQFTGANMGVGTSQKSKMTAGLLSIFLGALGGYHFYIGNTGTGILRLGITLLGIIPFLLPILIPINLIWNIIVGVLVLTSKPGTKWHQDAQGLELQD